MTLAISAWLSAFLFTQAVEVPVYAVGLQRSRDDAPFPITGAPARAVAAFGASLITHPVVWFLIPRIRFGSYEAMVFAAESFAVIVEALYFHAIGAMTMRRAILFSILANGASVTLGLSCRALFGWP